MVVDLQPLAFIEGESCMFWEVFGEVIFRDEEKVIELLNSIDLEASGDSELVTEDLMENKSTVEVQKSEQRIVGYFL